ncbi:putative reverse transcriptase domain-containing protein [Tanacetum coccineum]
MKFCGMAHGICWSKGQAERKRIARSGNKRQMGMFNRVGHTRNYCPKRKDPQGEEARGRAYVIKDTEKQQGPNVVTGTFLLNNRYATVLFDSGSDKSFVNTSFSHLIDINPVRLDTSYEVELADGRVVIIRMDWLVDQDAVIVCGKKVVHIPVKNKTLVVEGDRERTKGEMLLERCTEMIIDFPRVFPDDLPGLPPPRQVEFKIELVPGAAPVARALYRLAPSEMKELADQLQELSEMSLFDELIAMGAHHQHSVVVKKKKNKKYEWGTEEDEAFQTLKQKLCSAPILALPEGTENFVVYCDASHKGYGAVLMQREKTLYKLELPDKLHGIHNTFHVSNLKKCLADENLVIPLEEIQLDDKLHFIEEPVEIMDRKVKQLKQSRIPIVKVRWNSRRGPEYTWEREDFFKRNYPHLFSSNRKTRMRNRAPGRHSFKEGRM